MAAGAQRWWRTAARLPDLVPQYAGCFKRARECFCISCCHESMSDADREGCRVLRPGVARFYVERLAFLEERGLCSMLDP